MEDDTASSATMTSVTEDVSGFESDEVTDGATNNDIETSSLVTTSDANEEGSSTVTHSPRRASESGSPMRCKRKVCDVAEVSMEGDTSLGETDTGTQDPTESDTSTDHCSPLKDFAKAKGLKADFCDGESGRGVGESVQPSSSSEQVFWPSSAQGSW